MRPLFCLLLAMLLSGCGGIPYSSSTYRYSSPICKKVTSNSSLPQIRAAILETIPLGTDRQVVEQLIRENFHTRIAAPPDGEMEFLRAHPGWSGFQIHLYTWALIPAGSNEGYADFRFDKDRRLRDVDVYQSGGFL